MTMLDAMVSLAEGNPGAVAALTNLVKAAPTVDPQNALGPWSPLLSLDTNGTYGTNIHILFKDVCDQDSVKTLAVLRAVQLGLLDRALVTAGLTQAYHSPEKTALREKIENVVELVQARLSSFNTASAGEEE